MNIYIEPEELETVLNLIVSLKTKMKERNAKSVDIRSGKVNYGYEENKSICRNCAYESLKLYETPCNTCNVGSNYK